MEDQFEREENWYGADDSEEEEEYEEDEEHPDRYDWWQ